MIYAEKGNPVRTITSSISRTISISPTRTVRMHHSCLPQENGFTGKCYIYQTGRFPITSRKGSKYLLVAYHYDSNTIHAEPLKSQTGIELKTSYHKLCNLLTNRGLKPSLHIMDNECTNMLKTFMGEVTGKFQLVPPHIHHINSAELYIWTFKEHYIDRL